MAIRSHENLQAVAGAPDIWERIDDARRILLLLDYDGTLAPFNPDRHQARPLPGIPDLLEELHRPPALTVAIVSGRPVEEIRNLLGVDGFAIAGTHGFELYVPGQPPVGWDLSDVQQHALASAESMAVEIVGRQLTERKIATVAVHTRALNEHDKVIVGEHIERLFSRLVRAGETELRRFDGGYELRAVGRDKGIAVHELLERFAPIDLSIYIGDDQTDEDAFRALPASGIGIKVGHSDRQTAAQGRLESSESVRAFLQDWKRVARP